MIGIYKITNPKGKIYIGQSWSIETRSSYYKHSHCRNQRKLYNSIIKYGWSTHIFEVIHSLPVDATQEVLDRYETFYWQQCVDCGLEMLNIREPGSRGRISEETKLKWKGRVPHNRGKTGEQDPKWGKKWNPEKTKRRLQTRLLNGADEKASKRMKGVVKTKEHQDKISEAKKKPILHVESNVVYKSRKDAAIAFGFKSSSNLRLYIKKGMFKYI